MFEKTVMRCQELLTELRLESQLPPKAHLWLCITLFVAGLYLLRSLLQTIPPEDHVAISLVICFFLTQLWFSLEKTSVKLSLHDNRCWLRHHRLGKYDELSLPVSQIHSAKLEYEAKPASDAAPKARITLITSLGMIPINQQYQGNPARLHYACKQINHFLESQPHFLQA